MSVGPSDVPSDARSLPVPKELKVYQRRRVEREQEQEGTLEEPGSLEEEADGNLPDPQLELPIAQRREARTNAGKPPVRYGFEHDIANVVSYSNVSNAYKTFVASLQSVPVPKDWKVAKQDIRWKNAMKEELGALQKNKTWDLVPLPVGKRAVGCKWVFTVKQNPEGKVDRYKARLVAK